MAKIVICDDSGRPYVDIVQDGGGDEELRTTAPCRVCGEEMGVRPNDSIEEHIDAAERHVDTVHAVRQGGRL